MLKSKKGFLLIDALISIFITSLIVLIILNFYVIDNKFKIDLESIIEENEWKRTNMISNLNTCVIEKEDLSYLEH